MCSWSSRYFHIAWALCITLLLCFLPAHTFEPVQDEWLPDPTDGFDEHHAAKPKGKTKSIMTFDADSVLALRQKLDKAIEATARHLAKRIKLRGPFGGYELNIEHALNGTEQPWLHHCQDVNVTRDAMELCAMRQLQALNALCSLEVASHTAFVKKVIVSHLKELNSGVVKGLAIRRIQGVKRDALHWEFDDVAARNKSAPKFEPNLQAAIMAVTFRCAVAVKKPQYAEGMMELWAGLVRRYSFDNWSKTYIMVQQIHQVFRYLSQVSHHVSAGTHLHSDLTVYLNGFEEFIWKMFDFLLSQSDDFPRGNIDLAKGMELRANSQLASKATKKSIRKRADTMLAQVYAPKVKYGKPQAYMNCESIAGAMALLNLTRVPTSTVLVYTYIDLALDHFQMMPGDTVPAAATSSPGWQHVEGGFFFPSTTLHTAFQADCLEGLVAAKKMLDNLPPGLETISVPGAQQPDEPEAENSFASSLYGGLDLTPIPENDLMAEL